VTPSKGNDTRVTVKNFLRLSFTEGTGETITWKAERVGVHGDDD